MTRESAVVLAMMCLMAGTILMGCSRPIWWMLHRRGPDGRRAEMSARCRWYLRILGALLLLAAAVLTVMSATGTFLFQ